MEIINQVCDWCKNDEALVKDTDQFLIDSEIAFSKLEPLS